MASKWHRARVAYFHPIEDVEMKNIVTQYIPYVAGDEEKNAAALVALLLKEVEVPKEIRTFLDAQDTSSESLEILRKSLIKKHGFSLILGADLYAHPKAKNIAKIFALIEKYTDFNVLCVPPAGNAMGVSLLCDLEQSSEGRTVGYNVTADFTLSALGDGDLDMPALNQQEGTLTTNDKRIVPMNVAQSYGGYVLNDIANALGIVATHTIDYTACLPEEKGFQAVAFDTLPDYFDSKGTEHRGYVLSSCDVEIEGKIETVEKCEIFDEGMLVYTCNPKEQFSAFTNLCKPLAEEACLVGSLSFAKEANLTHGELVTFSIAGVAFERMFKVDESLNGSIAMNPTYDMGLRMPLVDSYRFNSIKINKVGS